MRYDIVIPHYNAEGIEPLATACIESIKKYSEDYRIIWVQNGESILPSIWDMLKDAPHVIVQNDSNLGFVKAVNKGLQLVQSRYVVIMNNDTEAVYGWLDKLSAPLKGRIVMSGPRTTTKESWQGQVEPGIGYRVLPINYMLAFFCVMLDARLIKEVGYLDEDFGVGFGDDDNYCARVHMHGLRMVLVQDLIIPHKHRSTFRAIYSTNEIREMQSKALDLHFRKLHRLRNLL